MTEIDARLHKVIVTGNIEAQTLLNKLSKSGKPAELWSDKSMNKDYFESQSIEKEVKKAKNKGNKNSSTKDQKETGKAPEENAQKSEISSAETPNGAENATASDGDKALQMENADGNVQGDGNGSGNDNDKKKKKSKGNNESPGSVDSMNPQPVSTTTAEAAPVPVEAQTPDPAEMPAQASVQAPDMELSASAPAPELAPAPEQPQPQAQAQAPEETQMRAPEEPAPGPSLHHGRPMEPLNFGPPSNFGPPRQAYQHGPFPGPMDSFRPMLQQDYMYNPGQHPPSQLGMSYSMAQPSNNNTSYYAPPYYSYTYPQHPMSHIPPPPSDPINYVNYDDRYNNNEDNLCRLM
ncbi:unnamed protein product [Amaranthus hypochondriacus]